MKHYVKKGDIIHELYFLCPSFGSGKHPITALGFTHCFNDENVEFLSRVSSSAAGFPCHNEHRAHHQSFAS
jgi:hypothetical protein